MGLLASLVVAARKAAWAQPTGVVWLFEDVGRGNIIPGCVNGMTLAGFEFGADGRPVLAWREENGCSGKPRTFWSRKTGGAWDQKEFISQRRSAGGGEGDGAHQLVLRSDGNPFLVYRDVGASNELNTYRADFGEHANGSVAIYLENLVPDRNCPYSSYSLAMGPGDQAPQWATAYSFCNGSGYVRINGHLVADVPGPRPALAVTADGTRHLLWSTGSQVYYTRWPAGDATPRAPGFPLYTDVNRFGGDVRLVADASGVLHGLVLGVEGTSADWDLGAIVYIRSSDGGLTWSAREYVDPNDDPALQPSPWNANQFMSLSVDGSGVPGVTFWRWGRELWHAKRDGPGGTWRHSLVTTMPLGDAPRSAQLDFDPAGKPVVAFYDWSTNLLRLARPFLPDDGTPPGVDLEVAGATSPDPIPEGQAVRFNLTVRNASARSASSTELTVELPPGLAFVSAVPAPRAQSGQTLVFDRWYVLGHGVDPGLLVSGATGTLYVDARVLVAGDHEVRLSATSAEPDADPADNEAALVVHAYGAACFLPESGLQAWWSADDTPQAHVGGNLVGWMSYAGRGLYEPGKVGKAFSLNGTTDYAVAGVQLYPDAASLTLAAWIRTSRTGSYQLVAGQYECGGACPPGANSLYRLYVDPTGRLYGALRDSTGALTKATGRLVADGQWHHVALVRDVSTMEMRLLVDGTVDFAASLSGGASGSISDNDGFLDPFVIGSHPSSPPVEHFEGAIDDVRLYYRAVTAAEIAAGLAAPGRRECGGPGGPPTILNPGDRSNFTGEAVSLQLVGSDPDGDALTYSAAGLPPGLNVDPASGLVSGTITGSVADYQVTVTVSDGTASAPATFTWRVLFPAGAPVLVNPGERTNQEGDTVSLAIVASDPGGDPLTFTATDLPPGLAIEAASGVISGDLGFDSAGNYSVTVAVTDGTTPVSVGFLWTVIDRARPGFAHGSLNWEPSPSDPMTVHLRLRTGWRRSNSGFDPSFPAVGDRVTGSGGGVVIRWEGPGGFSGSTASDPSFALTVIGTDPSEDFFYASTEVQVALPAAGEYRFWMEGCCRLDTLLEGNAGRPYRLETRIAAPVMTSSMVTGHLVKVLPAGRLGSFAIGASSLNPSTFRAAAPGEFGGVTNPPTGLTLDLSGQMQWTPTNEGLYAMQAVAENANGPIPFDFLIRVVAPTNTPPSLEPIADREDAEGDTIDFQLQASDPDSDALSFTTNDLLPPGISLDSSTGRLSGTIGYAAGPGYSVTVFVRDGHGGEDSKSFWWQTRNTNRPPVVMNPGPQTSGEGEQVVLEIPFHDPDVDRPCVINNGVYPCNFSLSVEGLPPGFLFGLGGPGPEYIIDIFGGDQFSYETADQYDVTVSVTDPDGATTRISFPWTVTDTNRAPEFAAPPFQVTSAEGDAIDFPILAWDRDSDALSFTVSGLPPGVTHSPVPLPPGAIWGLAFSGTLGYDTAGAYAVTLTVSDGKGAAVPHAFTWTVTNTNRPPSVTSPGNLTSAEGDVVSLPLVASDPDGDTLRFQALGLPAGLAIDEASGLIFGTLASDASGSHAVTVHVLDGSSAASVGFQWLVADAPSRLTISDATIFEGDAGTTSMLFSVQLSPVSTQTVSVSYATVDGTARARRDYNAVSGTLTFAPGVAVQTIAVPIRGDRVPESSQSFFVDLSSPTKAMLGGARAVGTIVDDDRPPRLRIGGAHVREPEMGTAEALFKVTLSAAWDETVTVAFDTLDGSAQAGEDYTATAGVLSFAQGETEKTIAVKILADGLVERRERFTVRLSSPKNALLVDEVGRGVIQDAKGKERR